MGYIDRLYSRRILLIILLGLVLFGNFSILSIVNFQSAKKILIQSSMEAQLPLAIELTCDSFETKAVREINQVLITNTLISLATIIVSMLLVFLAVTYLYKQLEKKTDALVKTNNERKENQKKLELAYADLESFFTNSMVGVGMFRGGRFVDRVNQRLADILKYDSPDCFKGRSMLDFHISRENFEEFGKKFYSSLIYKEVFQVEYPFKCKDGTCVWASVSGKAVDQNNPPDLNKGIVWIFDDITARREAEQKLVEMATTDALTGLTNRRHFLELGDRELCIFERHGRPLSLLMLDIDYFKRINDTYGHGIGDKALVFFAKICSKDLRSEDIFGRLGGEEFAVFLPDTGKDQALEIAERIRKRLEVSTPLEEEQIPAMSVSIGIANVRKGDDLERVLQSADTALYQAKSSGRNCVKIFS